MLVAIFSLLLTMVAGFVGPVSIIQIRLFFYCYPSSADNADMSVYGHWLVV